MKINNILILFIFSSSLLLSCYSTKEISNTEIAQNDSTFIEDPETWDEIGQYNKEEFIFRNITLDPAIKTVLCHNKEEELSLPIINLNSNEQLLVSFDDLDSDIKNYHYTILHCNSDWTLSKLMTSEYINGFPFEPITNYEFSFNTIQEYTHYSFTFPSVNMTPLLSGNYVFVVLEEGKKPILYKRFKVLETKLTIEAQVRRATLAEDRNTKHEIDFTIRHPNLVVADPFSDIKVHLKQNNKEDNAITNLTPLFVKNDELIYDYDEDNTFWGNNEFRHFDITSLRYQSERIKNISFDSSYNHVYLFKDFKRSFDIYSIEPDINGKFLIKSQEGWRSSIEADYTFVHFTLPVDHLSYGEIYIIGAFSDWELKDDFRLQYNPDKKQYETAVYLKQGYYNYHYALNDTSTKRIDVSFIEGTHYQTRNDYFIYVYCRAVGDRYDRFVGFLKTSSKELF